jgi:hypothetical protein
MAVGLCGLRRHSAWLASGRSRLSDGPRQFAIVSPRQNLPVATVRDRAADCSAQPRHSRPFRPSGTIMGPANRLLGDRSRRVDLERSGWLWPSRGNSRRFRPSGTITVPGQPSSGDRSRRVDVERCGLLRPAAAIPAGLAQAERSWVRPTVICRIDLDASIRLEPEAQSGRPDLGAGEPRRDDAVGRRRDGVWTGSTVREPWAPPDQSGLGEQPELWTQGWPADCQVSRQAGGSTRADREGCDDPTPSRIGQELDPVALPLHVARGSQGSLINASTWCGQA